MRSPSASIIAGASEGEHRRGICFFARRSGSGRNGDRRGRLRGTGVKLPDRAQPQIAESVEAAGIDTPQGAGSGGAFGAEMFPSGDK